MCIHLGITLYATEERADKLILKIKLVVFIIGILKGFVHPKVFLNFYEIESVLWKRRVKIVNFLFHRKVL
jgi:hypothetical protein